jgi:hypothetical protein
VLANFEAGGKPVPVLFNIAEPDYQFDVPAPVPPAPSSTPALAPPLAAPVGGSALPDQFATQMTETSGLFLWAGVKEIWTDGIHLGLVVALLVVSRARQWHALVAAFAIGHSLTYVVAARVVPHVSSRLLECVMAATVVFVAAENFWRISRAFSNARIGAFTDESPDPKLAGTAKSEPGSDPFQPLLQPTGQGQRWLLAGIFGLIHGVGFACDFHKLDWPADPQKAALGSFHIGLELGLVSVVSVLLLFVWAAARMHIERQFQMTVSVLAGLGAVATLVVRAIG